MCGCSLGIEEGKVHFQIPHDEFRIVDISFLSPHFLCASPGGRIPHPSYPHDISSATYKSHFPKYPPKYIEFYANITQDCSLYECSISSSHSRFSMLKVGEAICPVYLLPSFLFFPEEICISPDPETY
ncbi:hypothetical protein WA026_010613 [Henosepilachna vigintioctopunctata]|uniref:Uncharacterized protein n=1 Tax=Henosepilachna vigintioctopunctata TaxID=420089 RepID=A0AAW1VEX7_9CUCU